MTIPPAVMSRVGGGLELVTVPPSQGPQFLPSLADWRTSCDRLQTDQKALKDVKSPRSFHGL